MSHQRPEWSDITAWEDREKAKEQERARLDRFTLDRDHTYPADAKLDLRDTATVLDFEAHGYPAGKKEELIRRHFKTTPIRYYQRLAQIIRTPEAAARNPQLVRTLLNKIADNNRLTASERTT